MVVLPKSTFENQSRLPGACKLLTFGFGFNFIQPEIRPLFEKFGDDFATIWKLISSKEGACSRKHMFYLHNIEFSADLIPSFI